MKIAAKTLELRNIDQLIETATPDGVVMGKLDRVKLLNNGMVSLRVSGDTFLVSEDHEVNIRRSAQLGQTVKMNGSVMDLTDAIDEALDARAREEAPRLAAIA